MKTAFLNGKKNVFILLLLMTVVVLSSCSLNSNSGDNSGNNNTTPTVITPTSMTVTYDSEAKKFNTVFAPTNVTEKTVLYTPTSSDGISIDEKGYITVSKVGTYEILLKAKGNSSLIETWKVVVQHEMLVGPVIKSCTRIK